MSRVETAPGMDRLPWLPDEPAPRSTRSHGASLLAPALGAMLLVGGVAFWLGLGSVEEEAPPVSRSPKPAATVRLPTARPAVPAQPEVKMAPAPEVEPIVAPPMPVIEPPPRVHRGPTKIVSEPRPAPRPEVTAKEEAPKVAAQPAPQPQPKPQRFEPWPVREVDGAAGRLVRVGAFSSVHQAKRGWWAIVRVNPALKRLPALVVPVQSLRNGRVYYRLQMGTTSQAHSAVLCQRMRMIAQPCVVIGLSG